MNPEPSIDFPSKFSCVNVWVHRDYMIFFSSLGQKVYFLHLKIQEATRANPQRLSFLVDLSAFLLNNLRRSLEAGGRISASHNQYRHHTSEALSIKLYASCCWKSGYLWNYHVWHFYGEYMALCICQTHGTLWYEGWTLTHINKKNWLRGQRLPGWNTDCEKRICVTNLWNNLIEGSAGKMST